MEIIHIVLGKANPDRMNGVNKVVYNMVTEQVKAGKNAKVWGITPNPIHDFPVRNFETVLFKMLGNPFRVDEKLQEAILQNPKAVYHLHGGWIPVFYSLSKLFAKNDIRFVLTPHGAYNTAAIQQSKIKKWFYFNLFEKHILTAVYKVHSIGASETEGLNKLSPQTQSFLLPYGFELAKNIVDQPKEKKFTIGFVGRLDMHTKGLDLLLVAFHLFQEKFKNSKLWIIGDGPSRKELEQFVKSRELKNVIFWGSKFGTEKDELISRMHVFAHPSRNEGLPTAVLEAAAFGVPVLVTKATNVADFVSKHKAGISIENNSEDEVIGGILDFYDEYQAGKLDSPSSAGKAMLEQEFSWSVLIEKYDKLYT